MTVGKIPLSPFRKGGILEKPPFRKGGFRGILLCSLKQQFELHSTGKVLCDVKKQGDMLCRVLKYLAMRSGKRFRMC
jgi:hypothetical protein